MIERFSIRAAVRRANRNQFRKARLPRKPALQFEYLENRLVLADCDIVECLGIEPLTSAARVASTTYRYLQEEGYPTKPINLILATELAERLGPRADKFVFEQAIPAINRATDEFFNRITVPITEKGARNLDFYVGLARAFADYRQIPGLSTGIDAFYQRWRSTALERGGVPQSNAHVSINITNFAVSSAEAAAQRIPAFAEALRNNPSFGFDPDASISQIIAANDGSLDIRIVNLLSAGSGLSRDEAMLLAEQAVQDLRQGLQQDLSGLIQENNEQLQQDLLEAYRQATNSPDAVRQQWQQRRDAIDRASALGIFSSQILQFVDPALARQFEVATQAGAQIARSMNDLFTQVKSIGFAADALGGVTALAGIGGGVLQFASLINGFGPSTDEAILDELGAIRQMINQLRAEMHERFDRVDRNLNMLMEQVAAGFQQIDIQNRRLLRNVESIQADLLEVLSSIDQLQDRTQEMIQDADRLDFERKKLDCLQFRERNPGLPMPAPKYDECQLEFQLWATIQAKKPLWAGSELADYSVDAIANELSGLAPVTMINYVSQFPARTLGLPALAVGRVVNPVEWLNAANAYIELVEEWPQHARSDLVINDIISAGKRVEQASARIATLQGGKGQLHANRGLFQGLLQAYSNAIAEFDAAIRAEEQAYVAVEMAIPITDDYLNPWLMASGQRTSWRPDLVTAVPCAGGAGSAQVPDPDGLRSFLPPIYNLANRLRWGDIDACLASFEIIDWLPLPTHTRYTYRLRFGGVPIVELTMDQWTFSVQPPQHERRWAQTTALSNSDSAQQLTIINRLESDLRQHRANIYSRIGEALTISGRVQQTAQRLSGIRSLIETYLLFGMPTALRSHDILGTLFHGVEVLPGSLEFLQKYAHLSGDPAPPHQRFDPIAFSVERSSALESLLEDALSNVESGQQEFGMREVRETIRDLEAIRSLYLTDHPKAPPLIGLEDQQEIAVGAVWSHPVAFFAEGDQWRVTVDYGDGNGSQQVAFVTDAGSPLYHDFNLAHTYQADGDYVLSVTVSDLAGDLVPVSSTTQIHVTSRDGDLNGDNAVDHADLSRLLSYFGMTAGATRPQGDFNADGRIGVRDLIFLRNRWTPPAAAPSASSAVITAVSGDFSPPAASRLRASRQRPVDRVDSPGIVGHMNLHATKSPQSRGRLQRATTASIDAAFAPADVHTHRDSCSCSGTVS